MMGAFRTVFNNPETIDAVDSYEMQKNSLLEAEMQHTNDFGDGDTETDIPFRYKELYEQTPSAEELEYYKDYDPLVGYRIAISLGILILLFTVFVLYKTHCHQQRNRRLVQNAQS